MRVEIKLIVILIIFYALFLIPMTSAASKEALLLTEKIRLKDFKPFLVAPRNITEDQRVALDSRYGLTALMEHVALHFDQTYTHDQLKSILSLWDNPSMGMLINEIIGRNASVNKILSQWSHDRFVYISQLTAKANRVTSNPTNHINIQERP